MRKITNILYAVVLACALISCEKNDPISELGETNGQFAAQLRVSYNNTRPAIGDTLQVTASTWQRDDKFSEVRFMETIVETFGINMSLKNGTQLLTKGETESTLTVIDSIAKANSWLKVAAADMDKYWVTVTNNYVMVGRYPMVIKEGKYPNNSSLITKLSDQEFEILKGLLAYTITRADYLVLYPSAPASHFTNGGTYVLSQTGINNLKQTLTKTQLLPVVNSIKKVGKYSVTIDVAAITSTGTATVATRTFENSL
ncbi:hypothetical protein ACFU8T_17625 [Sphingobacterium spiritivorum]|uniref:Uncharacterized protein n=1 Tax=Sphingobacterium spiritivorum ATCC 33861 TaxID=525373 RepID=D7VLE7_SPHSI|nr:hypothetical protein [Sphingobacterium spiritivorum]EFK58420.1 hypothetical protein HMPREF0766_11817 [Sphingobacterium spiritivorum ATCC 33861]QQT37163.1 hypothetical protein I6J01_07055 [Sphingobacterium spiritivorum]WQD33941.1 hypothetical protein U0038_20770 [Sphingobacterium spiritivorum]SUJ28936.1 Uncharacterised protein [Sphingobacterium spiritivorum]